MFEGFKKDISCNKFFGGRKHQDDWVIRYLLELSASLGDGFRYFLFLKSNIATQNDVMFEAVSIHLPRPAIIVWFQIFFNFHPENLGRFPIWRAYFRGWNHQAGFVFILWAPDELMFSDPDLRVFHSKPSLKLTYPLKKIMVGRCWKTILVNDFPFWVSACFQGRTVSFREVNR